MFLVDKSDRRAAKNTRRRIWPQLKRCFLPHQTSARTVSRRTTGPGTIKSGTLLEEDLKTGQRPGLSLLRRPVGARRWAYTPSGSVSERVKQLPAGHHRLLSSHSASYSRVTTSAGRYRNIKTYRTYQQGAFCKTPLFDPRLPSDVSTEPDDPIALGTATLALE